MSLTFKRQKGCVARVSNPRRSDLVNILYLKQNVQSTPQCFNQMPLPTLSVLVSVLCKALLRPFLRASPKNGGSYKVDVFATWLEEIYLKQLGGAVLMLMLMRSVPQYLHVYLDFSLPS